MLVMSWSVLTVASKKKFWNPRKWFRRKNKSSDDEGHHHQVLQPKETLRSRSTSELSVTDERRYVGNMVFR